MTTDAIGLYLHIPFCVRKCNYCDFCSYPVREAEWKEQYISRLCEELATYKGRNIKLDTVFFGGGTPSLLSPDEFSKIAESIDKSFSLSSCAEFSMEVNPGTLTKEKMSAYTSCGVNRVSIGLQSIHENELKILGRIHNFDEFLTAYEITQGSGVKNINIDLMYGIPEQTAESFERTLDRVVALSPSHLSLSGLILEAGTRFWDKRDLLSLPDEDIECDMYYLAGKKLSLAGYSHYEISNYAKEGTECRHNLKYWRDMPYIGVGVSAYSYFDGVRFGNSSDINEYLSSESKKYRYEEVISAEEEAYEYAMLRLRLKEGFSLSDYKKRFGAEFYSGERKGKIDAYSELGYISLTEENISLTESGFYISNKILTDLL